MKYDVFILHSAKDKSIVRTVAERLRADGLRVWLDDWEIRPGDSIPAKIEEGLEHSRVLMLCMSANTFGSDWAQLESATFRFRDPLNRERHFIPLRLDETPIKASLANFQYINWRIAERERNYSKLLEVCRPPAVSRSADVLRSDEHYPEKVIQLDYTSDILTYAFSPDGHRAITGGDDKAVRLWEIETGRFMRAFEGHADSVWSVAWSPDQRRFLSGSADNTVRLWDVETGRCLRVVEGHADRIRVVIWSPDGRSAITGADDKMVRLWDVETGRCVRTFEGHADSVWSVAWSPDQSRLLSGSADKTLRLWDIETGRCLRVLEGHVEGVGRVEWASDRCRAVSGAVDKTVRLWDVKVGNCVGVLEGHTEGINSLAWSADQRHILSGAADNTVRLWDVEAGRCLSVLSNQTGDIMSVAWGVDQLSALSGDSRAVIRIWDLSALLVVARASVAVQLSMLRTSDQVQYTNAKVLLVGESGAGKTGLSKRLAMGEWQPSDSTVGAWATQWKLPASSDAGEGVEREIWLWDFGGQADQRLIHQLFMDETALAVLVFDPQKDDLFETLGRWDRDITRASRKPFTKLLVAGRVDAGGIRVSRTQIEAFAKERGFAGLLETSAKADIGCNELRKAILDGIRWADIPWLSSPRLFRQLKGEILRLKDEGRVLMRFNELRDALLLRLADERTRFEDDDLKAVVGLLAGPGLVWELEFGSWVLLRPETVNAYAQAVIETMRGDEQERGCIPEEVVLGGALAYHSAMPRLIPDEERVVLMAMHQTLVERGLCLREHTEKGPQLIFPSYYRRERPEQVRHPAVLVSYQFNGFLDEIYATLVVRLHHTKAFEIDQLWKFAADFMTQSGRHLGFKLTREGEGAGRLEVYFNPDVEIDSRLVFLRYIHNHLIDRAQDVVRMRHYACSNQQCESFGLSFNDQSRIAKALAPAGKGKLFCPDCGNPILLRDLMEEKFDSPAVNEQARLLHMKGQSVIDRESRELILIGHVFAVVAEAGQIYRSYSNGDHGIDGEIEFTDNQGRATGKRMYLQLKSGDSYLKRRQRDGAEVFQIKNARWAAYWQQQAYPVLLVIRTSDGEVRGMEVRDWLRRASDNGEKHVKHIVFSGERFDVMSVRRWRDAALQSE